MLISDFKWLVKKNCDFDMSKNKKKGELLKLYLHLKSRWSGKKNLKFLFCLLIRLITSIVMLIISSYPYYFIFCCWINRFEEVTLPIWNNHKFKMSLFCDIYRTISFCTGKKFQLKLWSATKKKYVLFVNYSAIDFLITYLFPIMAWQSLIIITQIQVQSLSPTRIPRNWNRLRPI